MPGQGKYNYYLDTVAPSPYATPGARGAADQTLLKTLFKTPATGDQLTQAGVTATANRELVPDVLPKNPDPTIFSADDIKLGFGAAPDIEKGPFSGQDTADGGPANPYFPNLTSPDPSGGGSTAPIAPTPLADSQVSVTAKRDVDGLVDPSKTSQEMSNKTKIGVQLTFGKHPGSL